MTTSTAAPTKIDPELERGIPAKAEELLDHNPERTALALQLQQAAGRYREAEQRCDAVVDRLEQIAKELRTATGKKRDQLVSERTELVGEVLHAPADIQAAAEEFADALSRWAPTVYRPALIRAKALRAQLGPLEMKRNTASAEIQDQKTVTPKMAAKIKANSGNEVAADRIDPAADETAARQAFRTLTEQIGPLREQRDQFADLAEGAQACLTRRFGQGYGDSNLDGGAPGRRAWLEGVRHRTAAKVSAHTGFSSMLKPVSA